MVQSWNGMADSYVIIYYLSSDYLLAWVVFEFFMNPDNTTIMMTVITITMMGMVDTTYYHHKIDIPHLHLHPLQIQKYNTRTRKWKYNYVWFLFI